MSIETKPAITPKVVQPPVASSSTAAPAVQQTVQIGEPVVKLPLASLLVKLDPNGSTVAKHDVTPAEALLLVALHHRNVGGDPLSDIKITGELVASPDVILADLKAKYNPAKVDKCFHPNNPTFPTTFERAVKQGVTLNLGKGSLGTFSYNG